MNRFCLMALLVFAVPGLAVAAGAGTKPALAVSPHWSWSLDAGGVGVRQEKAFHVEAGGVAIDARLSYEPDARVVRLQGVYRTRQSLDPRAMLSYHLFSGDGRLLRFEGERFAWRADGAGGRAADFAIEVVETSLPGLHPEYRVQFDYIVETEFWYRARHPAVFVPELAVGGPVRRASFSVDWAWLPPVLPAGSRCVFPSLVRVESSGAPLPYVAALDALRVDGSRLEAPRWPLAQEGGGRQLLFFGLGDNSGRVLRLRPGFVWEGVEWFSAYADNPYRTVFLLGPLAYAVVLTLAGLGLLAGWRGLRRVRCRGLRRAGLVLWWGLALGFLAMIAVSLYVVLAAGVALVWLVQRKVAAPGPRLYWTTWSFVVLLDLFWGHLNAASGGAWSGSLLSSCLAAVVLAPLHRVRGPVRAAWIGTGVGFLAALVATAMAVYFDFFRDYPGLRDLLYAGQLGEAGESVMALFGQRHFVSWWLFLCVFAGLWRSRAEPLRADL